MDDYNVFRLANRQSLDIIEAHVLARAYLAAWRVLYQCEPVGHHPIDRLGLAIDFGPTGNRRN